MGIDATVSCCASTIDASCAHTPSYTHAHPVTYEVATRGSVYSWHLRGWGLVCCKQPLQEVIYAASSHHRNLFLRIQDYPYVYVCSISVVFLWFTLWETPSSCRNTSVQHLLHVRAQAHLSNGGHVALWSSNAMLVCADDRGTRWMHT